MCAPAHVLMRVYPIDKSLVCLQSERRTVMLELTFNPNTKNAYAQSICLKKLHCIYLGAIPFLSHRLIYDVDI